MLTEIPAIIAMVAVMIGVPLISIPRVEGLYLMFIGQIGWLLTAYLNDSVALFIQSLFLLVFNVIGIRNWKKKGVGKK